MDHKELNNEYIILKNKYLGGRCCESDFFLTEFELINFLSR